MPSSAAFAGLATLLGLRGVLAVALVLVLAPVTWSYWREARP